MLLVGAAVVLGFVLFADPKVVVAGYILGGVIVAGGMVIPLAQRVQCGRVRRRLAAFHRGESLAHWTYSADECRRSTRRGGRARWPARLTSAPTPATAAARSSSGTYWSRLVQVVWYAGPPTAVEFVVVNASPNGVAVRQGFRVPVPKGQEADARRVVENLLRVPHRGRGVEIAVAVALLILALAVAASRVPPVSRPGRRVIPDCVGSLSEERRVREPRGVSPPVEVRTPAG